MIPVALIAALCAAPTPAGTEGASGDPPRIASIRVTTHDVYAADEAEAGLLYRLANRLHARTRESTVRRFLLFREGDPAHPEALAQTERNLRRQVFLREASVTARPDGNGSADVLVTTRDAWTTTPRIGFSNEGGEPAFTLSATERNLFGTGRKVKLAWEEDAVRIRRLVEFIDPHLAGPYRAGAVLVASNSDGHETSLGLARSFVATTDRRAAGAWFNDIARDDRLYVGGEETTRFRHLHRDFTLEGATAPLAGPLKAARVGAGIAWTRDRFDSMGTGTRGGLPGNREFATLYLRGEWVTSRALVVNQVNRGARFEDFELGPRVGLLAGVSPAVLGPEATTGLVTALVSMGIGVDREDGWGRGVIGEASYAARLGARRANAVGRVALRGFARLGASPPQAVVGRVEYLHGRELDEEVQFLADGSTGLRGYPLFAYAGNRRLLANLEHRIALGGEVLRVAAPGLALFADAGAAVPEGRPLGFEDVRADVGIGLRLAFLRAAEHDILRVDAAWPLAPDPAGRREILVTISSRPLF